MKELITFNQYDAYLDANNIDRHTFVHLYFPKIVSKHFPEVNFTMIGDTEIEWSQEVPFPPLSLIEQDVPKVAAALEVDGGVAERCYENGILVKVGYTMPANRPESLALLAHLPPYFGTSGAFNIGEGGSNTVYNSPYISIYFNGQYQDTNSISYAYKINKLTKDIEDIKLLYVEVPFEFSQHLPSNTNTTLYGRFLNNTDYVDVYFSFKTEEEYKTYLGDNYLPPIEYSSLGKGMVGLTVNTTTNEVLRTKRYFF